MLSVEIIEQRKKETQKCGALCPLSTTALESLQFSFFTPHQCEWEEEREKKVPSFLPF